MLFIDTFKSDLDFSACFQEIKALSECTHVINFFSNQASRNAL